MPVTPLHVPAVILERNTKLRIHIGLSAVLLHIYVSKPGWLCFLGIQSIEMVVISTKDCLIAGGEDTKAFCLRHCVVTASETA